MKEKIEKTVCYNCEQSVYPNDKYCAYCGQANHPTKLTIHVLLKEFAINFFNLDSRFFQTLRHIYSPTFLTREYLAGRRKSYANPIRLFIICMFVFFFILAYTLNEHAHIEDVNEAKFRFDESIAQSEVLDEYNAMVDTLLLTEDQKIITDSIRRQIFRNVEVTDSNYLDLSSGEFARVDMTKAVFLKKDIIELERDSLFRKYEIHDTWDKIIIGQIIKTITNPASSIRTLVGNSFWIIILIIIFLSFLLKLLYIRRGIYLLEHIIIQCNTHSVIFLLASIYLILFNLFNLSLDYLWVVYGMSIILGIVVMKQYYRQGIFKTIIKYLIYLLGYMMLFFVCSVFVVLVSFILL